jgi:hypothetical protein
MNLIKLTLASIAGWMNRQQQDVIDYLWEEVRVLLRGSQLLREESPGLGEENRLIEPDGETNRAGDVVHESRFGGLLNDYFRAA